VIGLVVVDCVWNVMAYAQKPDFVFRRNGRVHLNRRGLQFSHLLAAEVCASAVVMPDTTSSEVVWRVLATHSIHQFPLHFPSRASPRVITFQLDSNRMCHMLRHSEALQFAHTLYLGVAYYCHNKQTTSYTALRGCSLQMEFFTCLHVRTNWNSVKRKTFLFDGTFVHMASSTLSRIMGFFHWHKNCGRTMALGSANKNENQVYFLGVKADGA